MPLSPRLQDVAVSETAPVPAVIYLHGFASSPESTKASYFATRLSERGLPLIAPDFNHPDFRTLTMTRMLAQLASVIDDAGGRVALIGSSLGAAVALLAAARQAAAVDRLILLAPAVMLARPGHSLLPPDRISHWQHQGVMAFQHHAYGEERLLDYTFYEDSLQHDVFDLEFTQPTLIFQGLRDAVVDYRSVERFARGRSNVTLSLLDDDHQLSASLPRMWTSIEDFLGLIR